MGNFHKTQYEYKPIIPWDSYVLSYEAFRTYIRIPRYDKAQLMYWQQYWADTIGWYNYGDNEETAYLIEIAGVAEFSWAI